MSLAQGRTHLATPGPSIIPDKVLEAMHRAAPNIYEGEIVEITESVLKDLTRFAKTSGDAVLYVANGHGAWEAAVANLFDAGDTVLVMATGQFGLGWADLCKKMNLNVILVDFGFEESVDLEKLTTALRNDPYYKIKGIFTVQTDTASSVLNNIKSIAHTIEACNHPALFLVDSIACFGCDRFEMDEWGVDIMVTACQKGLMTPPGISYCFVGNKAKKFSKLKINVPPYWDWKPRMNPKIFYERFFGTAPTHHIFGQRAALDMMISEGRENIFRRHKVLAGAVWAALEKWGEENTIKPNIKKQMQRSTAVTTVRADGYDLTPLRKWLELNTGLVVGIGLGFSGSKYLDGKSVFRIAHMGHLNPVMLLGALTSIEAGFLACKIPYGKGGAGASAQFIASNAY